MDGKVKRLRKTKEGEYRFEIIEDIDTFVEPEQPEVTTETGTTTQPESGLFTRKTKERRPPGAAGELDPFIN